MDHEVLQARSCSCLAAGPISDCPVSASSWSRFGVAQKTVVLLEKRSELSRLRNRDGLDQQPKFSR